MRKYLILSHEGERREGERERREKKLGKGEEEGDGGRESKKGMEDPARERQVHVIPALLFLFSLFLSPFFSVYPFFSFFYYCFLVFFFGLFLFVFDPLCRLGRTCY